MKRNKWYWPMLKSRDVNKLRPDVAKNCNTFLKLCKEAGLPVLITNTVRDNEYQMYCYKKGTGGKPPATFHHEHYGLAFDVCKNVKGHEYDDREFFYAVAEIAKRVGFSWGFDLWGYDRPHFQWDEHGKYTGAHIRRKDTPPEMPAYDKVVLNKDLPSEWAKEVWESAVQAEIFDGSRPKEPITRQEVAMVLSRLNLIGGQRNE